MKEVRVGLVGSGFAADLHMHAYQRIYGVDAQVIAVSSLAESVGGFASKYKIPTIYRDYHDLMRDDNIDVVDICTPPALHAAMVVEFLRAGKHVICEKPFTGYFGELGDETPIGTKMSKAIMYERVMDEMAETCKAIRQAGSLFMYAEDWVYAPAVVKTAEVINATKDKILFIKAEESHSGSHAEHAARWDMTGGGALIRQGCHPLSAALYLKQVEAKARGEKISMTSITCDVGNVAAGLAPSERNYIQSHPLDVEDWACMTATFSDGTKATVFAGDMVLGGVRNLVETYTNGGVLHANMAPNDNLMTYMTDENKLANVYITEKVDRKTGWQYVCLNEEWTRGYISEIQDFMECVAEGRQPLAGLELAYDTIQAIYAAYWSAAEGKRITL